MRTLSKMHYWYWNTKAEATRLKIVCQAMWLSNRYKFAHWFFSWNADEDGAIVFSLAHRLHFIKYKEHTIIKLGRRNYSPAAKYVDARDDE